MNSASFQSLKNHFLIAMPRMADPSFAGTLTLICEHTPSGALGIIINRPADICLAEIFGQIGVSKPDFCRKSSDNIYSGGPVSSVRGFVLHSGDLLWESTLQVGHNLSLTTSKDVLFAMATEKGPEDTLVALGYAGWGHGQLEQEISNNCWLTCKANRDIIFNIPFHRRLDAAAQSIGVDLALMSNEVGHA